MGIFDAVKVFISPWMIVRHSRPNIGRTRIPYWEKLKVLETCKPMFAPDPRPRSQQCVLANKPKTIRELTIYEKLVGKELLNYLDSSLLVGIYHANSIEGRQKTAAIKYLLRNNMRLGTYNRYLVERILKETKYAAILPLFSSHTRFVFSKELSLNVLLKFQKVVPQYILLAGILENRLMSKKELEWYGSLPSLEIMHGQLYATLNAGSTLMLQNLNYHQMQLSHSLSLLAKPEEKEEPPSTTES